MVSNDRKKKGVERGAKRKSYQYPPCSEVDALSGVNDESNAKEGEEDGIGRIRGGHSHRRSSSRGILDRGALSLAGNEDVRGMRKNCSIFKSYLKGRRRLL